MSNAVWLIAALAAIVSLIAAYRFARLKYLEIEEENSRPTIVSFLTANIGNGNPAGIVRGFGLQDEDVPVIRRNIASMSPDAVFFQEVSRKDQAEAVFDTGDYHLHVEGDVCVALKKSAFEHPEPEGLYYAEHGCAVLRSRLIAEEEMITFIAVHAISPIKDRLFLRRGHQIKFALEKALEASGRGESVLLAGDFNFDPWRFKTLRSRLFKDDRETELDKTKNLWFDIVETHDNGLHLVSGDFKTWFYTYSYSIDHIVSNMPFSDFKVLTEPHEKLDIDHSIMLDHPRENFMDHRALVCNFEVVGEFERRALKKWLRERKRRKAEG